MTPPDDVLAGIKALPLGTTTGEANGRRYVTTRTALSNGRAIKLVAEELGGTDYISANLYDLSKGAQLYPCEMPPEKIIAFVRAYLPEVGKTE